jgi:hypothetical protein
MHEFTGKIKEKCITEKLKHRDTHKNMVPFMKHMIDQNFYE